MGKDLEELEKTTKLILDHELAQLRALSEAVAACRAGLAELGQAQSKRAVTLAQSGGADDAAYLTGRDGVWQKWLQDERSRRQAEVARALADLEAQRLVARRAFGRADAFREIKALDAAERKRNGLRRDAPFGIG